MTTPIRWSLVMIALAACGSNTEPGPNVLPGSYTATTFRVTPPGQTEINVLATGGSLTIAITEALATTGSLNQPASTTGGAPFVASMAGTVSRNGSSVTFTQSADTFVRDLTWTHSGRTITVNNQVVAGATYTITLTR